jgi:hypothetical protein
VGLNTGGYTSYDPTTTGKTDEDYVRLLNFFGKLKGGKLSDPILGANELGSAGTYSVYDPNTGKRTTQQIGRRRPDPAMESELRASLQKKLAGASDMGKLRDIYGGLQGTQFEPDVIARGAEMEQQAAAEAKAKEARLKFLEDMAMAELKATGALSDNTLSALKQNGLDLSGLTPEEIPSQLTASGNLSPGLEAITGSKALKTWMPETNGTYGETPDTFNPITPVKGSAAESYINWSDKETADYFRRQQMTPEERKLEDAVKIKEPGYWESIGAVGDAFKTMVPTSLPQSLGGITPETERAIRLAQVAMINKLQLSPNEKIEWDRKTRQAMVEEINRRGKFLTPNQKTVLGLINDRLRSQGKKLMTEEEFIADMKKAGLISMR